MLSRFPYGEFPRHAKLLVAPAGQFGKRNAYADITSPGGQVVGR